MQVAQDVALALELHLHAEIGHVARVDHEVDVVAAVECAHYVACFIIPALGVGDHGDTHDAFARRGGFDACDVLGVDALLAIDACVVGVIIHLAAD